MKYEITYACGHTETVQIYGTAAERERKAAWYASHDCLDCHNAVGCVEVRMSYKDYKTSYSGCKTKRDSYDPDAKTVTVYVPAEEVTAEDAGTAEKEAPTMTTEEFISAAKIAACPEYNGIFALAREDVQLMEELDRTLGIIREARDNGHTLVQMSFAELMTSCASVFDPRPAQDEKTEIAAAGDLIRSYPVLNAAIDAYHRQLPRETAVAILNGAYLLSQQPGACYLGDLEKIHAFPGYADYPNEFAKRWNNIHPNETPITAPIPDYI